jgi:hypothetical protein
MRRSAILLSVAILASHAWPAAGWNPDRDDDPGFDPPVADGPGRDWAPEPTPAAPPEGIYLVTDVYAGDAVVHSGRVTTYTTDTVHEITGSYARVLQSVGTGDGSAFDGASFNGRASLTDGRPVAGTYYENFVHTEYGFTSVSVVFFQDDSEMARSSAPLPVAAPPVASEAPPSLSAPPPSPSVAPIEGSEAPIVGYVTPSIDERDRAVVPPALTTTPPVTSALPDRSIEVLRGRRISIRFPGTEVRAWRLVSTEGIVLGPLSGMAGEPFVIRWDRLAPPNMWSISRFVLDNADGSSHELLVHVMVRAPGLVE